MKQFELNYFLTTNKHYKQWEHFLKSPHNFHIIITNNEYSAFFLALPRMCVCVYACPLPHTAWSLNKRS